jgi:hypothetical protein
LVRPLALAVRVGGRKGRTVNAAHGRVESWLVSGGLGLPVGVAVTRWLALSLTPWVRAGRVSFRGIATGEATGEERSSPFVVGSVEAGAVARLGAFDFELHLGVGTPLVGVVALDTGQRAAALTGVEVAGGLLVGWRL